MSIGEAQAKLAATGKYSGIIVEYLDDGRLRAAVALREYADQVVVAEGSGAERKIPRDLVLVRHPDRPATHENARELLAALKLEHERLAGELDLNLLWEIVQEDQRGRSATALAEIFFGHAAPVEIAVMLEALLNDRLYFVRRHMEFVPRSAEQVERLRTQHQRTRLRSEGGRQKRRLLASLLEDGPQSPIAEAAPLIEELTRYLENPFTRNRETATMLEAVAGELTPAEAAYEILERLGARPDGPRYALIGGLRTNFSAAATQEALNGATPRRAAGAAHRTVTIDDAETVEIDDALACETLPGGGFRVRVHIALVADFVAKGGPMDVEAAARGTTVYLPETTVRMLPDAVSTDRASLRAAAERHVLTTDVSLSATGEVTSYELYPELICVDARLTYDQADAIIADAAIETENAALLARLREATVILRERRRAAGARLIQRREPKVTVVGDQIDIRIIDPASPSRELVAELMVLSNYIAARLGADRGAPMIYRVQPNPMDNTLAQRARLSLYPEFHAGVGLECYVQASSPIRRYLDLVLQRQLIAITGEAPAPAYTREELMAVLAAAEAGEDEGRQLERRAKRYWTLIYLKRHALERPLEATVGRDGASAELDAYAVRGSLRGAPNLSANARVMVMVGRIDPVRGGLTLNYLETIMAAAEGAV
ncbi:MAG TPA: ribonuclease catalytic domain-containing protein [Candidatus Binataceae bacterium]|nr:ribonuclease catalytic domain-containing protein [Candidatus Binataceae bacterium]